MSGMVSLVVMIKTMIKTLLKVISFNLVHLKIVSFFGGFIILWSLSYWLFVMAKAILWSDPFTGYSNMMIIISFLHGVQLLAIGILVEH